MHFKVTTQQRQFTVDADSAPLAAKLVAETLPAEDVFGMQRKGSKTRFYKKRGNTAYPISVQAAALELWMLGNLLPPASKPAAAK